MLVLDPLVRLHRIDENVSGEVAPLLAYLRDLQRRHRLAAILVHHARKGAGAMRAGQALRGSSEFHAWADSNLYLRRDADDSITLAVEHRAAPAMPALTLDLVQRADALALQVVERQSPAQPTVEPNTLDDRIAAALAEAGQPKPFADLRASCRVRAATLYERIAAMTTAAASSNPPKAIVSPADPALPLPASHNPYSAREAEPGSPSKNVTATASISVILLSEPRSPGTTIGCDLPRPIRPDPHLRLQSPCGHRSNASRTPPLAGRRHLSRLAHAPMQRSGRPILLADGIRPVRFSLPQRGDRPDPK
jgi:hypothetical protein